MNDYIFFAGKRIARKTSSAAVYYYLEDHLGTSRAITDSSGNKCYDADFYPFGGERVITNTCPQNYKFTGKERDAESGNDDYGARYYASSLGRFLSPDWSAIPVPVPYANLSNPQTLNLYAMVSDNPETFADLDGHGQYGGFHLGLLGDAAVPSATSADALAMFEDAWDPSTFATTPDAVFGSPKSSATNAQPPPDGIAAGNTSVLSNCSGCNGYGIKIALTYQLTASGQPLEAAGYIMQERLSRGEVITPNGVATVSFASGWNDIGPTPANGNQRATDSKGQFTDAPLGMTGPGPFTHHATQELRAVNGNGDAINFGKNKVTVTSDAQGHGKIVIDNKQMKIHVTAER